MSDVAGAFARSGAREPDPVSENLPRNPDYAIARSPDLATVSPGARIRYSCTHHSGQPPEAVGGRSPYRDTVRWYKFRQQALLEETRASDPDWARPVETGPVGQFYWSCTWNEPPGRYVVGAEVRGQREPSFCFLPQYVEAAGRVLGRAFDALGGENVPLPTPYEAEDRVAKYLAVLDEDARRVPPRTAQARQQHRDHVERWQKYARELRKLLEPVDGRPLFAAPALHLEAATQVTRRLHLILARLKDESGIFGGKRQRWALVDWTEPTDSRFRGRYEGTGATAEEAIDDALDAWRSGNRYPVGLVTCDIPAAARGRARRHQMETDGKTFGDEVVGVLEWVALGAVMVAGVVLLFTPVAPLGHAALGVSLVSSTGAAVIAVSQRWREGIFDPRADAIDGLTVLGGLLAAGGAAWARGARVRGLFADGADRIFIGARIGTDLVQGILVADSHLDELRALTDDPDLVPEERARKLLVLFQALAAGTLLTYFSLRASARDLANLDKQARHLTTDDRARSIRDKLSALTDPDETLDPSRPPVVDGHTRDGTHHARAAAGTAHHPKVVSPNDTELAKKYPEHLHPWIDWEISGTEILLWDRDRFIFKASCIEGTLEMTVVTYIDPAKTSPHLAGQYRHIREARGSDILRAKVLYPLMYQHFADVGNPVKKLVGPWAWDNYAAVKNEFDRLRKQGMSTKEATKLSIRAGVSYRYHEAQGLTELKTMLIDTEEELIQFELVRK
jgi:hypothetical protein